MRVNIIIFVYELGDNFRGFEILCDISYCKYCL